MSIESRSSSALFKRAEQLKRWANSDTNREPVSPKNKSRRIKFSSGCVFLAACASGDKEEVTKLLEKGADINTANVDGLTALHQACIDDNLDMVEYLVGRGADVNRGDNEGWTPLHATASCGFESIAKYLLDNGADVAAINNDGELAIDIVEEHQKSMRELLSREIQERGVDCELARSEEERTMLSDAREWLNSHDTEIVNSQHPKTGGTALHVAAAKGYIKVINILIQCKADADKQDYDGWTALHAASYWGQREASTILTDNLADMDIKNYVGQSCFDVAVDTEMLLHLEELKKRQNKNDLMLSKKQAEKKKTHLQDDSRPPKVKRVQLEIENNQEIDDNNQLNSNKDLTNSTVGLMATCGGNAFGSDIDSDSDSDSTDSLTESSQSFSNNDIIITDQEKKNRANSLTDAQRIQAIAMEQQEKAKASTGGVPGLPTTTPKQIDIDINSDIDNEVTPSWRRPGSFKHNKNNTGTEIKEKQTITKSPETEVTLRRTQSFQSDPKLPTKESENESESQTSTATTTVPTTTTASAATMQTKNTPTSPTNTTVQIRRSFVPPVRDEESETQRKKHAKRVRETRRSTQGVTLDEIKSAAEQLNNNKTQQQPMSPNSTMEQSGAGDKAAITASIVTLPCQNDKTKEETQTVSQEEDGNTNNKSQPERRPSWRLRVDNGTNGKFKLEDATSKAETNVFIRKPSGTNTNSSNERPMSAPELNSPTATEATTTITIRRPKSLEDKDQDKENDARGAQAATLATQAAIQRRRRPKRRSTGVVHLDMDDMEGDKGDPGAGGDTEENSKVNNEDSGSESTRSSNRGSRLDLSSTRSDLASLRGENGELDYKKMYEQAISENDRLREKLRKSEDDLKETKNTLEKLQTVTSKNSLSELEKRERRAIERKLSEMEEELKQLQKLKSENERLRAENRALTRVVTKLTSK